MTPEPTGTEARACQDIAFREALRLASSIWRTGYQEISPDWEPLDTTEGIISQIDNMYAGVRFDRDLAKSRLQSLEIKILNWSNKSNAQLRLQLGELTANEIRCIRAVLKAILS